jgi:putative ABC transport system permease protein
MLRNIELAVSGVDKSTTIKSVELVDTIVAAAMRLQTVTMYTTATLAGIGFVLSIIGISAAVAYTLSRRQRDIGIRLALGATTWPIARAILLSILIQNAIGISLGLVLAIWISRQMSALIYGVGSFDLEVYVPVALVIVVAVSSTILVQLRRLLRINIPSLLRTS